LTENNEDNEYNEGHNGKITMVGSSFGGLLSAEFAARYGSKIEKLVLVSPVGTSIPFVRPEFYKYSLAAGHSNYEDVLSAFRNMVYDPNIITKDMVEDFIQRMQLKNAIHAFDSTVDGIIHNRDLGQRLSKVSSPVQII
jgi:2-hydroxy-6-oxonona-2,4-dienedioate hydrolase